MSSYEQPQIPKKNPIIVTTGQEWIGITVVLVLAIVVIIVIYIWLRPRIRQGSSYVPPRPPSLAVTCATSPAPSGLTADVNDVAKASFDASWTPVLVATTPGATVIGYNIFVSKTPGITLQNTKLAGFAPTASIRVTNSSEGKLDFNTIYYFKVATVDTCGQGELSTEEFQIET